MWENPLERPVEWRFWNTPTKYPLHDTRVNEVAYTSGNGITMQQLWRNLSYVKQQCISSRMATLWLVNGHCSWNHSSGCDKFDVGICCNLKELDETLHGRIVGTCKLHPWIWKWFWVDVDVDRNDVGCWILTWRQFLHTYEYYNGE